MNYHQHRVVGTCSICGGQVTVPQVWMGTVPPVPTCNKCYATAAPPELPVLPMIPHKPVEPIKIGTPVEPSRTNEPPPLIKEFLPNPNTTFIGDPPPHLVTWSSSSIDTVC